MGGSETPSFGALLSKFRLQAGIKSQEELAKRLGVPQVTINAWESGESFPQEQGALLELANQLGLDNEKTQMLFKAASLNLSTSFWLVPYLRNPFFTGREEGFQHLHNLLTLGKIGVLTQPQSVGVQSGFGKTHVALEYAYRYRHAYQMVFWVRASSRAMLYSDFATIAHMLKLPERDEQDQNCVLDAVRQKLKSCSGWLLIFDDIEDFQFAEEFLSSEHQGCVLLTTSLQLTKSIAHVYELDKLTEQEGVLFLLRRMKALPLDASPDQTSPRDYDVAKEIWKVMDALPLALDLAGAYILEMECSLSDYLDLYQRRHADLLGQLGDLDHPQSIITACFLSLEKAEKTNRVAADLLRFCAFLYPDMIPEEIIIHGAQQLGPYLEPGANDSLQLNEAVEVLCAYSLLDRNTTEKTLRIHRLVQSVLKDNMDKDTYEQWIERTVRAVVAAFAKEENITWSLYDRYLPHVQLCATLIEDRNIAFLEVADLLFQMGCYLIERVRYSEAEPLLKQTLGIWERLLGTAHLATADALDRLARVYEMQEKYGEAEPLYRRALAIREQQLGQTHVDVATSMDNLALLFQQQGKYSEAELLHQQALTIYEQQVGAEHFDTAASMYNLAELYQYQRKYEEAEPLYLRALAIWEQQLGLDDPHVALILGNLAELYLQQGKYADAEPFLQRLLAIQEQQLEPHHPDIVQSLNGLALLYLEQGKYSKAEPLYQRALAIREQQRGPNDPDTALSLSNLALLFFTQGKYSKAEPLYQRALKIWEQQRGPEHLNTVSILNNLASLSDALDKDKEAEQLYLRALEIWERQLGPMHSTTAGALHNLATFYLKRGKYGKAESLLLRAVAIREQQLGSSHPDLAWSLHNLAGVYSGQGKYQEAERLYQRALAIREQKLGSTHPDTASSLNGLAQLYYNQDKYNEAEPLYQRALKIWEQELGPSHSDIALALSNLATLYHAQGRYTEAGPLYRRALSILKQQLGATHSQTLSVQAKYTRLLEAMNRMN